jgi:hypothetical protein
MPETLSLKLPLLVAEQAQKHVTHNEALRALDAIVQLSVKDRDLTAPPGSPADGDRYIVAASPTGVWAGRAGDIAVFQDGAWDFHEPLEGWRCWVDDENVYLIFDGSAWIDWGAALGAIQNLSLLGIGTTADATNPFSAKLNKALWTAKTAAEGGDGDLRYTMNKEAAADVLSLLLQRGFSGRAELGLIGDDDFTLKVSPDGSTWHTGLVVDKDDGRVVATGIPNVDYGTWTPAASFATPGDSVLTASSPTKGYYTKIGNDVFFWLVLSFSTNAYTTAAGGFRITGLPFTSLTDATLGFYPVGAPFTSNVTFNAADVQMVGFVPSNSSRLDFYTNRSAAAAVQVGTANVPPSTANIAFRVSGSYRAA